MQWLLPLPRGENDNPEPQGKQNAKHQKIVCSKERRIGLWDAGDSEGVTERSAVGHQGE